MDDLTTQIATKQQIKEFMITSYNSILMQLNSFKLSNERKIKDLESRIKSLELKNNESKVEGEAKAIRKK